MRAVYFGDKWRVFKGSSIPTCLHVAFIINIHSIHRSLFLEVV
ncbi:hypothetical protein [Gracilibacillus sp. JCM 18860]